MLQAVSSVYMAHISARSHSFWRDGTDCKKPLETAQNYAYIKQQISTRKNWSKQTHERTSFISFLVWALQHLCLFGYPTSSANQPLCCLIRPIHHGKDENQLRKDCQGDENCTILSEGHRPAKQLNRKRKINYVLLPQNLFLWKLSNAYLKQQQHVNIVLVFSIHFRLLVNLLH